MDATTTRGRDDPRGYATRPTIRHQERYIEEVRQDEVFELEYVYHRDLIDEETANIEIINITNMNYNDGAIAKREADIIFLQEHKLKGKAVKKVTDRMKDQTWTLKCGPVDETTKNRMQVWRWRPTTRATAR